MITKQLLKSIKFPTSNTQVGETRAIWSKSGGHAGRNTIIKVMDACREAGFAPIGDLSWSEASPGTGSSVSNGNVWVKDTVQVTFRSLYGATASDNRFTISVTA